MPVAPAQSRGLRMSARVAEPAALIAAPSFAFLATLAHAAAAYTAPAATVVIFIVAGAALELPSAPRRTAARTAAIVFLFTHEASALVAFRHATHAAAEPAAVVLLVA